ncbi:MAG: hypothetical protein ACI4MF_09115 [Candidatus Faecivicinus sp.]
MNFKLCEVVRDDLDRRERKYSDLPENNIIKCGVNIRSRLNPV